MKQWSPTLFDQNDETEGPWLSPLRLDALQVSYAIFSHPEARYGLVIQARLDLSQDLEHVLRQRIDCANLLLQLPPLALDETVEFLREAQGFYGAQHEDLAPLPEPVRTPAAAGAPRIRQEFHIEE